MLYAHRQAPGKKVVVYSCIFVIIKMSMYFENGFDRCGKQKNLIDLQGWQTDKGFLALKQGQTVRMMIQTSNALQGKDWIKWQVQIAIHVHIMYMTRMTRVITAKSIWMRMTWCG